MRAAAAAVDGHVDLAFLFVSRAHEDSVEEAAEAALELLRPAHLLGCVAEGVIAGGREVEEGPAVAVWAARLPGATLDPFHAVAVETVHGPVVAGFPDCDASLVAMLVDPFSFPGRAVPLAAQRPPPRAAGRRGPRGRRGRAGRAGADPGR